MFINLITVPNSAACKQRVTKLWIFQKPLHAIFESFQVFPSVSCHSIRLLDHLHTFSVKLVPHYSTGDGRIWLNSQGIWCWVVLVPEWHLAGYEPEELPIRTLWQGQALMRCPKHTFTRCITGWCTPPTCPSTSTAVLPLAHLLAQARLLSCTQYLQD